MFRVIIFLITIALLALAITLSMLNPLLIDIDLYFDIFYVVHANNLLKIPVLI